MSEYQYYEFQAIDRSLTRDEMQELRSYSTRAEARRQAEARKRAEDAECRKRQAAAARAKHLDEIAGREPEFWARIEGLIATKQPNRYDEAVNLLKDLRDLARRDGKDNEFERKLNAIHAAHARKPSFLARLRKAGL